MHLLRRAGQPMRRYLPNQQIRWRIMWPYAGLALLLGFVGTFLITTIVTDSLEERFTNQLAESARVTSDAVVRRESGHLEVLRSVTFTEGVSTALASTESSREQRALALERLVLPLVVNYGTEVVELLDARGQRVYGTTLFDADALVFEELSDDGDRSTWPLVRSVIDGKTDARGDKFAAIVSTDHGTIFYTSGPVFEDGALVGVVLVGSQLSSMLGLIRAEALSHVTFYDTAGTVIGTTFPVAGQVDGGSVENAFASPSSGLREVHEIGGREYELLFGELRLRDQTLGLYSVGLATNFIATANSQTRTQMGVLFAFATIAILLVGWVLARRLTHPILQLVSTARAVARGDLTARSGVSSPDEIGVLAGTFDSMTERLQRQHLGTIKALVSAIDARDAYTRGHSVRVGHLSVDLGRAIGFSEADRQHLQVGGYLHDIGKIGIRDAVLLKPDRLTDDERALIEEHPRIGLDILRTVELPPEVTAIVGGHHEKLDGSGYPLGLDSEQLSLFPRIAAVADIYDALITDRPYRAGMDVKQVLEILAREAESGLLDQQIVVRMFEIAWQWEQRRRDDPELQGYSIDEALAAPLQIPQLGGGHHLHPHPHDLSASA